MPKFACRCSYVMNLSHGWSSVELALLPESRIEQIADKLDTSERMDSEVFYNLIDTVKITVYRCPSCGRLHVDRGGGVFLSFIPEKFELPQTTEDKSF